MDIYQIGDYNAAQVDVPAQSPFLPGTNAQFAWDSTSLGALKECPRKYYYQIINGYRSRSDAVPLTFGTHFHKGMEYYHMERARGSDHDEGLRFMIWHSLQDTWEYDMEPLYGSDGAVIGQSPIAGSGKPWDSGDSNRSRETLIRTLIWYFEQFGDSDPAKVVTLKNGKPATELSFRLNIDSDLVLCGHLDQVVTYQDQLFVMDHKTTKTTISSYYFDQYSPDNQMTLYTLAGSIITENPIRGVIIDAAQIAVNWSRFERGMVYRTQDQLEEWLNDTKIWIAQAHLFSERNYWPQNDKSCHKFGGCPFRGICSSDPRVREPFIKQNFTVRKWNPLEVR